MPSNGKNPKIKSVLIDLDNTLYNYNICNSMALNAVFLDFSRRYNVPLSKTKNLFFRARKDVKKLLGGTGASHSRLLYFKRMIERLTKATNPELSLYYESLFWDVYFKHMKLYPDAKEFLLLCRKNNIRVAIVTDLTAQVQLRKIIHLKISKYINFIITSEEVGKDKPNPNIFVYALKMLDCKPNEVILVGDDIRKDMLSATKLGISAYRSFSELLSESYF